LGQQSETSIIDKSTMHSQTTDRDKRFVAGWRFASGGIAVHPALPDEKQAMDIFFWCP
jgi:hypothetical protein